MPKLNRFTHEQRMLLAKALKVAKPTHDSAIEVEADIAILHWQWTLSCKAICEAVCPSEESPDEKTRFYITCGIGNPQDHWELMQS